jgi:putative ABC transport system substrate-binding protein
MNRRALVGAIAVGLYAACRSATAQQPKRVWHIGFLAAASRQFYLDSGRFEALQTALRELGYVEGKNLVIEARYADGQYELLPAYASELVRLKVDVILAASSPAIRAAKQATSTIPIVFPSTGDPVGSGFVASLAHPGGNLTGMSNSNLDVSAKTLELLRAILPGISRVAVLANPGSSTESAMLKSISAAAQLVGVQVVTVEARSSEEIEAAFSAMPHERVEALVVAADALMGMQQRQIADLALRHKLPSISQGAGYARAGGLMGYGLNSLYTYALAAAYIDKIFKGARPADLPVQQPSRLELVINMKTAHALGLAVPRTLLLRADELIQ